jgi:hypothetical protein
MTATSVTGRGPGESNKSLKPVLDHLINQFNDLKIQIVDLQNAIESGEGTGLQTDFQGEDVTMNANGPGGTFHTNGGEISFDSTGGGPLGYIRTGNASPYGGIGIFCMASYECNWQDGVLSLYGPTFSNTGKIKLGNVEIKREEEIIGEGQQLLIVNNCTIQIANLPVFSDNTAALNAGLPENTLYTTSSGELRVVRD